MIQAMGDRRHDAILHQHFDQINRAAFHERRQVTHGDKVTDHNLGGCFGDGRSLGGGRDLHGLLRPSGGLLPTPLGLLLLPTPLLGLLLLPTSLWLLLLPAPLLWLLLPAPLLRLRFVLLLLG